MTEAGNRSRAGTRAELKLLKAVPQILFQTAIRKHLNHNAMSMTLMQFRNTERAYLDSLQTYRDLADISPLRNASHAPLSHLHPSASLSSLPLYRSYDNIHLPQHLVSNNQLNHRASHRPRRDQHRKQLLQRPPPTRWHRQCLRPIPTHRPPALLQLPLIDDGSRSRHNSQQRLVPQQHHPISETH